MDSGNFPESIPIGRASDLEKQKKTLSAVEVKNKVRWFSEDLDLPLKFELGRSSKIGLFLTSVPNGKTKSLEVMPKHGRSGILGRVVFSDKQGSLFRELDLKGSGKVLTDEFYPERRLLLRVGKLEVTKDALRERTQGIVNMKDAEKDRDVSEYFFKNGIRVPRVAALIELEEIIDEHGQVVSVDLAKKQGLIQRDIDVGLEVRAFVTKARVSDSDADNWGLLLEDARRIVASELGKNADQFTEDEYALWFAKTLGLNIGKMHSLDYFHGFLTRQNITLDCRIVDFDSARSFKEIPEEWRRIMQTTIQKVIGYTPDIYDIKELAVLHDYLLAYSTLENLLKAIGFKNPRDKEVLMKMSSLFEESYIKGGGKKLPEL